MQRTKRLKGECQHCEGQLEFPAENIGLAALCPHCRQQTELLLAAPKSEPVLPRRTLVWTAIAILILGGGLLACILELQRLEHWAARHRQPAPAGVTQQTNGGK